MSSSLEDLFGQILYSEQKAHERRSFLSEVKQTIAQCRARIEDCRDEQRSLRGRLVTEMQAWTDAEVEAKCRTMQTAILSSQLSTLREETDILRVEHDTLETESNKARETFCEVVKTFTLNFDLLSYSNHQRDMMARGQLERMEEEKHQLEEELECLRSHQQAVDSLMLVKEEMTERFRKSRRLNEGIERELRAARAQTGRLDQEKTRVSKMPQCGMEYQRLREELEACRGDAVEAYCKTSQCQLQELQQQLWQRQMTRR